MQKFIQSYILLLCTLFIVLLCNLSQVKAQTITNYTAAPVSPTVSSAWSVLSGGTSPTFTNDGTGNSTTDEGYANAIPIGFDFFYMGVRNTTLSASTNGWLAFNYTISSAMYKNNLSSSSYTKSQNLLAPFWADLDIQNTGNVTYKTTGNPGSRVFTIQYLNVLFNYKSTNTISFQIQLYETTGVISYIYSPGTTNASQSSGASIGISSTANTYLALSSPGGVFISTSDNASIKTCPALGTNYIFTPLVPTPPTNLTLTGSSSTSTTLNWLTPIPTSVVGYVIYNSTDGTNYNYLTQTSAGTKNYTATLNASLQYYWKVYAVSEGALSLICTAPAAPNVISLISYCLNSTATPLTATALGSNTLLWTPYSSSSTGFDGATAVLSNSYLYMNSSGSNYSTSNTTFTTTKPNVTITSIDYSLIQGAYISNLVLSIYNSSGTLVATSSTNTSASVSNNGTPIKIPNTFNFTIALPGTYSVAVSAGNGYLGTDNPSLPIPEITGTVSTTAIATSGNRCFNNIQFSINNSITPVPTPSTAVAGSTNYYVYQSANGCISQPSTIIVNVTNISQVPAGSIIANYRFNGTAHDTSGNANNGTFQAAPTLVADRFGVNSAYSYNGTTQYMSTTTALTATGDFSEAIWFKTVSTTGGKLIGFGSAQTGSSTTTDRNIWMTNAGTISFNANASNTITSPLAYNDGNWHLVTGTVTTGSIILYIDGKSVISNTSSTTATGLSGYWRIGNDITAIGTTSSFFSGTLDNALIYNRLLTSTEVGNLITYADGANTNSTATTCLGSSVTLYTNLVGSYLWTGPNGFSSTYQMPPAISVSSSNAGAYLLSVTNGGCTATAYTSVGYGNGGRWTGSSNTTGETLNNWCLGSLPTIATNILIPSGLSNYPTITSSSLAANNIVIQAAGTGTITTTPSLTVGLNGILPIAGTITNAGIFDASNGTIVLNGTSGTSQTIAANTFANNNILNLIISNATNTSTTSAPIATPATVTTLTGVQNITGTLTFGTSGNTLTTALVTGTTTGLLTIKSYTTVPATGVISSGTATIGDMTSGGTLAGNTIAGNVIIERYIPAKRAWRLLAVPLASTTQTVFSAWQEAPTLNSNTSTSTITNPNPGYGTEIPGGSYLQGFDKGNNSNATIKYFTNTSTSGTLTGLTSTNGAPITSYPAYFLFVRGDRTINLSQGISAIATNTTLRVTGAINQGTITPAANNIYSTGYSLMGNPYASPIDFNALYTANSGIISQVFYVWDPKLGGSKSVGGYVAVTSNGTSYTGTPQNAIQTGGNTYNQYIPSGEAFFLKAKISGTAGKLIFSESNKYSGTGGSDNVFRPMTNGSSLRVNILGFENNGSSYLTDGTLSIYNDENNNGISGKDVTKLVNIGENFSISRNKELLAIEFRHTIGASDTTFLHLSNFKLKKYQLQIIPENLSTQGLFAVLKDNYSSEINNTPLSMTDINNVQFTVNTDTGSYAVNRFSIVFKSIASIPSTLITATAAQLQNNINVSWKVPVETDVHNYTVEESATGINFTIATTMHATVNQGGSANYNWIDSNAATGLHYYRIKSTGISGKLSYSAIVKVAIVAAQTKTGIIAYPNTFNGTSISFLLNNIEKGTYNVQLYNMGGQLIAKQVVEHDGINTAAYRFIINNHLAGGQYKLQLSGKSVNSSTSVIKE